MEDMKAQIELKVIAAQLADWCKNKEGIIFKSSLCTQERVIRFQTPLLLEIFPNIDGQTGVWKSGCFILYEIYNSADDFKITCSVSEVGLSVKQRKECKKLLTSFGVEDKADKGFYVLREWSYPNVARNLEKIMEAVQAFFEIETQQFEEELAKWKEDQEDLSEEPLIEGGMKDILTNKYERNRIARKKCIAKYGTSCQICGFDFGVTYGPEFAGKIHVHHKIPLYEIKEDYVVDPINDLIPVCPNCHMVLHSKPDGFYTVDEVREMIN